MFSHRPYQCPLCDKTDVPPNPHNLIAFPWITHPVFPLPNAKRYFLVHNAEMIVSSPTPYPTIHVPLSLLALDEKSHSMYRRLRTERRGGKQLSKGAKLLILLEFPSTGIPRSS